MDNIVREAKQRFDGAVEMQMSTTELVLFADGWLNGDEVMAKWWWSDD